MRVVGVDPRSDLERDAVAAIVLGPGDARDRLQRNLLGISLLDGNHGAVGHGEDFGTEAVPVLGSCAVSGKGLTIAQPRPVDGKGLLLADPRAADRDANRAMD